MMHALLCYLYTATSRKCFSRLLLDQVLTTIISPTHRRRYRNLTYDKLLLTAPEFDLTAPEFLLTAPEFDMFCGGTYGTAS